jgi:hypothetical protein
VKYIDILITPFLSIRKAKPSLSRWPMWPVKSQPFLAARSVSTGEAGVRIATSATGERGGEPAEISGGVGSGGGN